MKFKKGEIVIRHNPNFEGDTSLKSGIRCKVLEVLNNRNIRVKVLEGRLKNNIDYYSADYFKKLKFTLKELMNR